MAVRIVNVQGVEPSVLNALVQRLQNCLRDSVSARSTQVEDKYRNWQRNYDGVPKQAVRSKPFQGASNFMPQLIKMHTDILTARVTGLITATRPIWKPSSFLNNVKDADLIALARWMQWKSLYAINLPERIDMLVHSCFKSGTNILKDTWMEEARTVVTSAQQGQVTGETVTRAEVKLSVLPFEDFYPYPLTALSLEDTSIQFHRIRLTEYEVQQRKKSGRWASAACDALLKTRDGQGASNSQQQASQDKGIALTPDVGRPYSAIEAHFVDDLGKGQESAQVMVFNPAASGQAAILRHYYEPGSDPFSSPFIDFRLFPNDKNFYCTAVPDILEDSQEEQAQIHNSRRDASLIANVPGWKKKRYSDVPNPSTEWYPGKVFELDNMQDLEPLAFQVNYNSLVEEEQFVLQLAERYTGVSPASQGQGAGVNGKRGNYASQGTLALLSESNRRLDMYLRRVRQPFHKLGTRLFTNYRDFGDPNEFTKYGPDAERVLQLFKQDSILKGGGTFFDLAATDAGANRETERSGLLLMANTMAAYYHELSSVAQMVSAAPPDSPVRELMLQIMDGGRDLANRLLFLFDIDDRDKKLPDLRALLSGGAGPQAGAGTPTPGTLGASLPEPQGPVSPDNIRELSGQLTKLTSINSPGVTQ